MDNELLRKARALSGRIGADHHGPGADRYYPQLAYLARQVRKGSTHSSAVPRELSLGVARIIDKARAA